MTHGHEILASHWFDGESVKRSRVFNLDIGLVGNLVKVKVISFNLGTGLMESLGKGPRIKQDTGLVENLGEGQGHIMQSLKLPSGLSRSLHGMSAQACSTGKSGPTVRGIGSEYSDIIIVLVNLQLIRV